MNNKSFAIHDTHFGVTSESKSHDFFTRGKEGDWQSYRAVRQVLKDNGYVFHDDPTIRNRYKTLNATHHAGSNGPVHFHSEIYPVGFKFEFYEDVPRENQYGGRYGFDKMGHAPYLWRLRVKLIHQKIAAALIKLGFVDTTEPKYELAVDAVVARQNGWKKSHPYIFDKPPESYNATDQDGALLAGGELRYFYGYTGRLERGIVYRMSGNCWDVVISKTEYRCAVACWDLFTYDASRHPRKLSKDSIYRMSKCLEKAILNRNFLKAHAIQQAIDRIAGKHVFKVGDPVVIANPRYHGEGIIDSVSPPFFVDAKLPSGNVRRYEWPTVKPALELAKA